MVMWSSQPVGDDTLSICDLAIQLILVIHLILVTHLILVMRVALSHLLELAFEALTGVVLSMGGGLEVERHRRERPPLSA